MLPIRMKLALCLLAACVAAPAYAQFQPAPGGFAPPPPGGFSQPTAQSPWDRAPGGASAPAAPSGPSAFDRPPAAFGGGPSAFDQPAAGQEPPCLKDFLALRDDTEKKAKAVQAASKRKPTPQEACKLFTSLVGAQDKLQKFAAANVKGCGIPAEVPVQIKTALTQTDQVRAKVCEMAARGPAQSGPSLSDALGTSQLTTPENTSSTKRGGSTFDTLSGNALSR